MFSNLAIVALVTVGALIAFTWWGSRWGATKEERAARMPGDEYFSGGPSAVVSMARAISLDATGETVWPWLAQLGRGAGWYSFDILDNGGKMSARHIVTWIPEPQLGDASPIGYLRHVVPDGELTWWVPGLKFFGAATRLAVDIRLRPEGRQSRLVIRMSADAAGVTARPALLAFRFIVSHGSPCRALWIRSTCGTADLPPTTPASRPATSGRATPPRRPRTGTLRPPTPRSGTRRADLDWPELSRPRFHGDSATDEPA